MGPDEKKDADADAAIDRAVREMMSAEPRADFGRRVRARLESPALRRSSGQARILVTIPRLATIAALTAAVALFVLTRENRPAAPVPESASHTEPGTRPAPATPERPSLTREVPRTIVTVAPRRQPAALDRQVQAASIDINEMVDAAADVEPLKPIAPIAPSATTPAPIAKTEIHIVPLDVSPIEIAPLITPRRVACEENAC
jgi:hypothetical protein